ncbi:MAG: cell division protein ZapA [candidate division NC10 bacterium]
MTKNRVEFELLGQKYAIRSDATPEYVRRLVAHVEKTIKQIQAEGGPQDPQKLAVLAAFYITDALFQSRGASRQKEGAAVERVGTLLELLEKTARPS